MKEKIITAFQDNHRDLLISKKTGQFEDVLYNTGYETAMSFVLGLMGISKEEALNMKEVEEEIKMKNVRESQLKKCIFMETEEFDIIIKEVFGEEYEANFSLEGIDVCSEDNGLSCEEINEGLSKYFDVEVTSTHIDDCDYIGVWICYKEKEEN